ncbi:MAG TPA: hypothetical protein ENI69_09760 [Rhodospirillales bacterium]|nr:hypothetical protein [Rhodospirillales bacterium]
MKPWLSVAALLFVTACATPDAPPLAPEPSPPVTLDSEPEIATAPASPTPPGINLLPHDQAGRPTGSALKPENLIGLIDAELEKILGTPQFRRNDPPAQIWQYRNPTCRFDVFLYQDKARANAYAVTYVEARGLDVNRVSSRDCFLSVLQERNKS